MGKGLIQGARTSGPGNWGGCTLSPGGLASSRHHLTSPPPIVGPQESPSPSEGSVTSFPELLAKVEIKDVQVFMCVSVCACVHVWVGVRVCMCKSAPSPPPEIVPNTPKSLTLLEGGTGNGEGKSQKGLG